MIVGRFCCSNARVRRAERTSHLFHSTWLSRLLLLLLPENHFFDHVFAESKERNGQNKNGRCFVVNPVPNSFQTLKRPTHSINYEIHFPQICEFTTVLIFFRHLLDFFTVIFVCRKFVKIMTKKSKNFCSNVCGSSINSFFSTFAHFFGIFLLKIHFNEFFLME